MRLGYEPFFETVKRKLEATGKKVATVEREAGLTPDTIRNVLRAGSASGPQLSTAVEICEALGLELYIGPPRDTTPVPEIEIDSERFAAIPRFEAELAAGAGRLNHDEAPVEHLAFNRTWLERLGLPPSQACLLRVKGESMLPELHDGDMVLIDRRKRQVRDRHVYAFVDLDGLARVKRLEVTPGERIILRSDNPEFQTEIRERHDMDAIAQGIIGEVVWSGHTWS